MHHDHSNYATQKDQIRAEIAYAAARLITENGETYNSAKLKAARQLLGPSQIGTELLPDNNQIEQQVRLYHQLFYKDSQPIRLRYLRELALEIMTELARFNPYLTGAVLNGTAGQHTDITLQLYTDNNKDVAIHLLNQGIQFDVSETARKHGGRQDMQETLSFVRNREGVHLVLFATDDLRQNSSKKTPRANAQSLQLLIQESSTI